MTSVVSIFLCSSVVYEFNSSLPNTESQPRDQPLTHEGLDISASIEPLIEDKKIEGGEPVKITVKVTNTSQQQSRYLTVKSGFQYDNFTYLRNIAGASGVIIKDGEITFANIVMQPQQTQEINFEATSFGFENKEFTATPSLIDTTDKVVAVGDPVRYTVGKGVGLTGGAINANAEGER